jgi:3-oxoacyl-[acyl-carrier protein] reductase
MSPEGVLAGKAAIVTGSGRGIGRATAELLAAHGARVLISDLDGDAAAEACRALGTRGAVHAGDITAPGGAEAVVQAAVDAFGRIDIIVNNAGYNRDVPVHKMSDGDFQSMLDIHLVAPFRIIRAAAPYLREPAKLEASRGEEVFRKIVNVSSISGTAGAPLEVNYAAGKAGLVGITKALAKEWGRFKVNVNAVAFGFVETRLTGAAGADNVIRVGDQKVALGIRDREAERARAAELIPLGRWGTAEEAAGGVFLLCTPWSNYIHGQVLHVTGGLLAGMSG